MVPNGSKWLQNGSKWVQIAQNELVHKAPNGYKGHQICPGLSKWVQTGPNRIEQVQMNPNWSKLFQKGLNGSKWGNQVLISPNVFKWVHRGPNGSKWVNIGPNRLTLIQIHLNRSNKKSNMICYGLILSKIVQIQIKKSSKWDRHIQVSWSIFFYVLVMCNLMQILIQCLSAKIKSSFSGALLSNLDGV